MFIKQTNITSLKEIFNDYNIDIFYEKISKINDISDSESFIIKEYFDTKGIIYHVVNSTKGGILSKITNLIYLLDYSTIYAAVLNKINPSPVESIDFIKSRL